MNNEVLPEMNVSNNQNAVELSCYICEEVLSEECVLNGVSDNMHEIEFSGGVGEKVSSDQCMLEVVSDIKKQN